MTAPCDFRPSRAPWPSQMCANCGEWRDDHDEPISFVDVNDPDEGVKAFLAALFGEPSQQPEGNDAAEASS